MTTASRVPQNAISAVSNSGPRIFGTKVRFGTRLMTVSAIWPGDPMRDQSVPITRRWNDMEATRIPATL